MTKNAQDLNLGDIFYHNELKPWKVIEQPILQTDAIINVLAENTKTKKTKTFKFGRMVQLDLPDNNT